MTDTPQDQPLWRVMCDAYCEATDSVARDTETIAIGNAAEIRAVAGDARAARRFLHEAGFTDERGQWLPQFQPMEDR